MQSYSLPSSSYVDLTLGASGSTYTAPADGYIGLDIVANSGSGKTYLMLRDNNENTIFSSCVSPPDRRRSSAFIPIQKGYKCMIEYADINNLVSFRFIYAKGAQ